MRVKYVYIELQGKKTEEEKEKEEWKKVPLKKKKKSTRATHFIGSGLDWPRFSQVQKINTQTNIFPFGLDRLLGLGSIILILRNWVQLYILVIIVNLAVYIWIWWWHCKRCTRIPAISSINVERSSCSKFIGKITRWVSWSGVNLGLMTVTSINLGHVFRSGVVFSYLFVWFYFWETRMCWWEKNKNEFFFLKRGMLCCET